jgi:hypothetical protein
MSYRDAYNRAERRVEAASASSKDSGTRERALKGPLERAERSGDNQQADAIYHLACERGYWGVADTYLQSRPKAKERWESYAAARQEAESLENRLFGWTPPRRPHELSSGGDAKVSGAAKGISDMFSEAG